MHKLDLRDDSFLGRSICYKLYNSVKFVNGCCLVIIDEIKMGRYYQYLIVCSTLDGKLLCFEASDLMYVYV